MEGSKAKRGQKENTQLRRGSHHRSAAEALGKHPDERPVEDGLLAEEGSAPHQRPSQAQAHLRARRAQSSRAPLDEEQTHNWSQTQRSHHQGSTTLVLTPSSARTLCYLTPLPGIPLLLSELHTTTSEAAPCQTTQTQHHSQAQAAAPCFKGSLMFPWHGLHSQVTRNQETAPPFNPPALAARGTCTCITG